MPQASSIHDWNDLKAIAGKQTLSTCDIGRSAGMGMELRWLERALGIKFKEKVERTRQEILAELAQGHTDLALLATPTLFPNPLASVPPLRAIVTFGPNRDQRLPEVPTFAEVSGDKTAQITGSVAVFGPPGLSTARAKNLSELFVRAGADPKVRRTEAAFDFSTGVSGPDAVRDRVRDDARMMREEANTLGLQSDQDKADPARP